MLLGDMMKPKTVTGEPHMDKFLGPEGSMTKGTERRERTCGNCSDASEGKSVIILCPLHAAAEELLEAAKAQHDAIDWLMAQLIIKDPTFFPTKSPVWLTLVKGNAAIKKAEARDL